MKNVLLALATVCLLLPSEATASVSPQPGAFNGCPTEGKGNPTHATLNRLKNRSAQFVGACQMTVAALNALPTAPSAKVNELQSHMVVIEGFLVAIK